MTIEHLCSECKFRAMLVPYGVYKNSWVLKMSPGDEMLTLDEDPILVRIHEKTVLPIQSPMANSLSLLIYGKPIETVTKAMFQNWGHDIQKRNIILIIYEPIESRTQVPE